jgi:hypothetical protein
MNVAALQKAAFHRASEPSPGVLLLQFHRSVWGCSWSGAEVREQRCPVWRRGDGASC